MSARCKKCNSDLIVDINWRKSEINANKLVCKFCANIAAKAHLSNKRKLLSPEDLSLVKNRENLLKKITLLSLREEVFNVYGNKCECCGCDNWLYLNIDHINGRTPQDDLKGPPLLRFLRKNNYPRDKYRILCQNCNSSIGHHGFCPHTLDGSDNCQYCQISINKENTFEYNLYFKQNICKICMIDKSIKYSSSLSYDIRLKNKNIALNIKMEIIKNYGGKCHICNEYNPFFLTIDHINGGGVLERKYLKKYSGVKFYKYLLIHNSPKDKYRLLCYNCNTALGLYGEKYIGLSINDAINLLKTNKLILD